MNRIYEKNFLVKCTNEELISVAMEFRLIKDEMVCTYCNGNMVLKKAKKIPDGFNWRCLNTNCSHYQTTQKIKSGSFFDNFRLSLRKTLNEMLKYANLSCLKDAMKESDLKGDCMGKLRISLIEKIKSYFTENPIRLGGPGRIVQVYETKLNYNVKSHRGHSPAEQVWAIVIVDTSVRPSKGYVEIIERRDAQTLLSVISRVVSPNSTIHSDEWAAYNNLSGIAGFTHNTVTHKYNFVDPQTGVHTQHVESYNNKIKYKIKQSKGVIKSFREDFKTEFLFFDWFRIEIVEKLFDLIKV